MSKIYKICEECSLPMTLLFKSRAQKFCSRTCAAIVRGRAKSLVFGFEDKTKEELVLTRKNWHSARGSIRQHAQKIFSSENKPRHCHICGYSRKIEICHIKPIKDFPPTATIAQINHPDNLVALCANHHWELDHGQLDNPLDI